MPNSLTKIGSMAFWRNDKITSINIPNSVTIIGSCAFYNCNKLENLTIPANIDTIGLSAFSGVKSLTFENCKALDNVDKLANAWMQDNIGMQRSSYN